VIAGRPGLAGETVLAFAAERLANFKRPKSVEVWPELPKSAANKIMRREVRDRILARIAGAPVRP
jgi:acyl-coenzyme A synthetase/AMP-(fatty) acid ligase